MAFVEELPVCVDLSNRAEKSVISYNLRKLNLEGWSVYRFFPEKTSCRPCWYLRNKS